MENTYFIWFPKTFLVLLPTLLRRELFAEESSEELRAQELLWGCARLANPGVYQPGRVLRYPVIRLLLVPLPCLYQVGELYER